MELRREHQIANGNVWETEGQFPNMANIIIPANQLLGLSKSDIFKAVQELKIKARATTLLEWFENRSYYLGEIRAAEHPRREAIEWCMVLGMRSEFKEIYLEIASLASADEDLSSVYRYLRERLDDAYDYIKSKKSKPTAFQLEAKNVILELRNGCKVCGMLDHKHLQKCPANQRGRFD